ncbi:uncharacterized protein [Panulirus ornatus]|uniref:uncharacterized protein isoform X2 n=1 Tax=Panulirus ornatus TaxID=150431 RepID=UPI003A8C1956
MGPRRWSWMLLPPLMMAITGAILILQVGETETLTIESETAFKEELLRNMTEAELHHYFGGLPDPVFYLVQPKLLSHQPRSVRLIIRSPDLSVDSVLTLTDQLVASHLTSVYIDGEWVNIQPDVCHFRSSNVTHVITVNNCSDSGLDGIIITPEQLVTLHPLSKRFTHLVEQHLPCTSLGLDVDEGIDNIFKEKLYGFHILHISRRDDVPLHGRKKRQAEEEQEETMVCATGPEHDMSRHIDAFGHVHAKPHYIRSLNEIMSDTDLQDDLNTFQVPLAQGLDFHDDGETHNHTVIVQPANVVTRKTVELAVFADKDLYENFPERVDTSEKSRVVNYILTLINAVQGIYHQEELQGFVIDIYVVRLDIHTSNEGPSNGGGDIGAYLTSFCSWQEPRNPEGESNPEHWDHAIMLSGLDLHSSGNPSVIGLAWVGGMCRPSISCTMNEGRSFMSVYVVAHEMGHNLGMNHDGQGDAQQCSSTKYIMSPSVGPGKTTWSSCSISVIHNFLRQSSCLDDGKQGRVTASTGRAANTLSEDNHSEISPIQLKSEATVDLQAILQRTPGYQFALPDQCKVLFGMEYYPALTKFDLCDYLYCTNGVVTKPAHPALEGSFCGSHRVCIAGKCQPEEDLARLILYNIPSIPHSGGTPSPVFMSPSPPPTTTSSSSALTTQSLEISAEPCATTHGATSCPTLLPLISGNCSCNLTTNTHPPHSLPNIPREICPFIAPVYHQLFNCTTDCSEYDLHIDLSSGNLTRVHSDMTQLENAAESCFFGSYTIISDDKTKRLSKAILKDIRDPVKDPYVCQALPHLLHPALHCPRFNPLDLEKDCMPQKIIIKMAKNNYTYIPEKQGETLGKSLHWKGINYSFLGNIDDDGEEGARTLFAPLTGLEEKESHFSFVKCDLEAKFPKELENLPKAICHFLAPALHDLFNCSFNGKCPKHFLFINLLDNNVTKVPVKTPLQQELPCTICQPKEQSISNVLVDVIQAIMNITVDPNSLCKLLPSSWQAWVPSCGTASLIASVSEDACPPMKIVIQADDTAFTYTSDSEDEGLKNQPMIEWRGKSYVLERVSTTKEIIAIMEEEYNLDFNVQTSRKSVSHELSVMSHLDKRGFELSPNIKVTARYKSDSHSGSSVEDISQGTAPRTSFDVLSSQSLQEYVGQNDVFLPLNAPKAMPRTKVSACSVTCGPGTRLVQMECVDVLTNEVVDDNSCQGYITPTRQLEPCHMPQCQHPSWSVSDWGTCSETCGAGVQYRRVECAIHINQDQSEQNVNSGNMLTQASLVVNDQQCEGDPPHRYRDCKGSCLPAPWCKDAEDCFNYSDVQISRDFDY